jgi:hypothetical protein
LPAATTTVAYSQTLTATGGTAPYSWSLPIGTLPAGITLSTGGVISGTTNVVGSFNITVRATDANLCTQQINYTFAVSCPPITITPASLPVATWGSAYTQALTATGGVPAYTWSLTSGALPTGMTLNATTGVISGTPTSAPGNYAISVRATDINLCPGNISYLLTVNCPTLAIAPTSLPQPVIAAAYNQTLTTTGGQSGYTYTVSSGSLPAGLSLSNAGVITGTPTSTANAIFTVRSTDANSCTGTRSYSLTPACAPITVNPTSLANGTLGLAYSQTITATGGLTPHAFTVSAGTLPAGLTLNATTGLISGTPTASNGAGVNVTVRATDAAACFGERVYALKICPVITVNPTSLPNGVVGTAYSQTISATGGATPIVFSVSSGTLPVGLTLNATSGLISGTPTSTTSAAFTITATDANSCTGSRAYTITPPCPTISITPATATPGLVGSAYTQTLTATGGTAPYGTWTITAGTLPAGLTLGASTGIISGTPTAAASPATSITVRVNDANGCQGTQVIALQICPVITVNPATLPAATVGTAYSQTVSATGGSGVYTFAVSAGALPTWATLNATTGVISGTPNSTTAATFTIRATDANNCSATRAYTITPTCPTILVVPFALPVATVGSAYSQTLAPSGGTAPYSAFTLTAGTLPAGLTLSSAGVLSGTPTASNGAGVSLTIRANDAFGCQGTQTITFKVCPVIGLTPTTLTVPSVGSAYSQSITGTGGATPYVYAITAGAIPAWATFNTSTGALTGMPNSVTAASFTVRATDANGCIGTQAYTVTPVCPTMTITTASLPFGTVGSVYSQALGATGGSTPYVWTLAAGTLPAGLTLSGGGVVSGTPTASNGAGTSLTFRVTDTYGCQTTRVLNLRICPVITLAPASLAAGTVSVPYSQTVTASNGATPYVYAVSVGTLPPGLTLNASTGVISGTPSSNVSANITISATDANACVGTQAYTLSVGCPAMAITPATLPAGLVGSVYSQTLSATGGTGPYSWTISAGTLPAGLTLSGAGVLSGTPTTSNGLGVSITARALDTTGCAVTQSYTLQICPVITVNPTSLANGTVGTAYTDTLSATGGTGPYTFAIATGSLPAWATLNGSTGVITGTPNNTTAATFTIRATDANSCSGTRVYTITPVCPVISITPAALTRGTVGIAYNQTLAAAGGTGPYSAWTVTAGALPAGLALNSGTGAITGTPTTSNAAGVSFTVRVNDSYGCQGTQVITLQICPVISLSPTSLGAATVGTAYSQTVTATGGATPYGYTVSGGALPTWATLNASTGAITGTPNSTTAAVFIIRATDANGCTGTRSYSITPVCPTISITPTSLAQGTVGSAYSQTLTATGGTAPYGTWTITAGTLPAGLTLNASTGIISGTPTAAASPATSITVRVNDTYGCQGTQVVSLQICPVITVNPTSLWPMASSAQPYSQTD